MEKFRIVKIELPKDISFKNSSYVGLDIFFNPDMLTENCWKKINLVHKEIFGYNITSKSLIRVGKCYKFLITDYFLETDEYDSNSLLKEIYNILDNETLALINMTNDNKLIRFVSMIIIKFGES